MFNLQKKFLFMSIGLVLIITFAYTIWSLSLANQANVKKVEAILNEPSVRSASAQTYQIEKAPTIKEADWIQGDRSSRLQIFVYEDYASLYSANLAQTLKQVIVDFPKAAIIYRPYINKINPVSGLGAQAMVCAGDKWASLRENIFGAVLADKFTAEGLGALAAQAGLNSDEFNQCLSGLPSLEKSVKLSDESKIYSVQGAPTMFINGEMIVGARPYEEYIDSNGDKVDGLKTILEKTRQ